MRSFHIKNMHYALTVSILGLDLSLTSTGWATKGKTGSISVKTKESQRLYDIRKEINRVIEENGVNAVVVEGYAFAARNSQSHKIGELGGVIRLMLFELGIPYVEVPPTCRAKFATGRGNAAKTEVISAVSAGATTFYGYIPTSSTSTLRIIGDATQYQANTEIIISLQYFV